MLEMYQRDLNVRIMFLLELQLFFNNGNCFIHSLQLNFLLNHIIDIICYDSCYDTNSFSTTELCTKHINLVRW